MAEVLLEIAQNVSIRGMNVNGDYLFSVLDLIKYICPGYSSIYAPTLWYRLISNNSNEVTEIMPTWQNLKFKGRGQRNTPCMTILGLQKLLLILGSKATVEFCDRVLECFHRVLAGDHTSIREIKANPAQTLSVQPMERAETGAPVQGMLNPRCDAGDAGVMNELLQAACDPTAGQRVTSMGDPKNYTVETGAPVQDILKGMLGPRCDENRDASHQLELKIQAMHDSDFAKSKMKVETWTFHGDGTTWVNATSIFKYMYTGSRDNFARMQKLHFENMNIPHKLLEVPGVNTRFLFCTTNLLVLIQYQILSLPDGRLVILVLKFTSY